MAAIIVDKLVTRASLVDSEGKVTSGSPPVVRYFELQDDGLLKTFDFNDNTFKTGTVTTISQNMTHQEGNNGTYDTGIWTHVLSDLDGFTRGAVYLREIYHETAAPDGIWEEVSIGTAGSLFEAMTEENETAGVPETFEALVVRIARKLKCLPGKIIRDRAAGTVSVRNNEDTVSLNVEEHYREGDEDTIEVTT